MLFEKALIGKQYVAIEIFAENNRDKFSYLEAEQKKNEIVITKEAAFDQLKQLQENKTKKPAALVINNLQVLTKEIVSSETSEIKIIHQAFPNLKADDFFYEVWRKDDTIIISICRKSYIKEILQQLGDQFNIAGISLGICAINSVTQFSIPDTLYTNHQVITITGEDTTLKPLTNAPTERSNINGLNIPNSHLMAFCGILNSILQIGKTGGNISELNLRLKDNYKQKAFFDKGLVVGIIFIISILLINFFLFSYYFDASQKLTQEIALSSSGVEAAIKAKERISDKEQKLKSFTASSKSKSSVIINDVVKSLPSSILLSELEFNPLEKKIKAQEAIATSDNIITIAGTTLSNEAFTSWIATIEKLSFVKNVTINSFGKNDSNRTEFKIKVNLNK